MWNSTCLKRIRFRLLKLPRGRFPLHRVCPSEISHVELPALERGAVWPAYQVERLWDSLVRGFPIGCFPPF